MKQHPFFFSIQPNGVTLYSSNRRSYSRASPSIARAGWLLGLGEKNKISLPDIVNVGKPVLHEPAKEVEVREIRSDKLQNIIDDMVAAMRKAPGILRNTLAMHPRKRLKAQDKRPFDLLALNLLIQQVLIHGLQKIEGSSYMAGKRKRKGANEPVKKDVTPEPNDNAVAWRNFFKANYKALRAAEKGLTEKEVTDKLKV
ncbi:hypothetical protein G4B88_004549 [Cannabis sativa]|uniref:peptide deformylase n=1 Tax=Cannabis sativa TaxID=3483 RepID=A0A7J6DP31_CANSA|nr:hypothetical protein G4B88_004549 [Cannabis sativa]